MSRIAYGALWLFVFSMPWETILILPGIGLASRIPGMVAAGLSVLAVIFYRPIPQAARVLYLRPPVSDLGGDRAVPVSRRRAASPQVLDVRPAAAGLLDDLGAGSHEKGPVRPDAARTCSAVYVAAVDSILLFRRRGGDHEAFRGRWRRPQRPRDDARARVPMAWYLGMFHERAAVLPWICRDYLPVALVAIGLTGSRGGMLATMVALLHRAAEHDPTCARPARDCHRDAGPFRRAGDRVYPRDPDRAAGAHRDRGGLGRSWAGASSCGRRDYAGLTKSIPIMGYGTGYFKTAITPILGTASQVAHNSFISVLVEHGHRRLDAVHDHAGHR